MSSSLGRTRVGNWQEDAAASEAELAAFREKMQSGELEFQRTQKALTASQTGTRLSRTDDGLVRSGDVVAVKHVATGNLMGITPTPELNVAIGVPATCAPAGSSAAASSYSARLVLSVESAERGSDGDFGAVLNYASKVRLKVKVLPGMLLGANKEQQTGYLASQRVSLHVPGARYSGLQPVYFETIPADDDDAKPSGDTLWELQYFPPDLRFEHEGEPVHANRPLIIKHVKTGQCLAALEKHVWVTDFGRELELACHTHLTPQKIEDKPNVFMLEMSTATADTEH